MTRILIFSVAYEPLVGGAELAVRNITDRLSHFQFDLITCRFDRRRKAQEKIGNVNVYRVGFGSRIGRMLFPVLASRLAKKLHMKHDYKIVWSIMAAYAGAAGLLFKRHFPRVKFLLTLQEGDPIEHVHKQVRGFKNKWQQIFHRADYIQAISKFLADWARQEGATCPVEAVPNGVDIRKFKIQKSKIKMTDQKSKFIIVTTSRLVPKNGIDILIRALAVILSGAKNPNVKLQILGSGPEEARLKTLAAKLKIEDSIEFLGHISQAELPQYLSLADIFVRPSRSEGLGISFLEAMAVGLPVIGTAVGGIPEFLHDFETGLFCHVDDPSDLAQKIKILIEDKELRAKLARNGRQLVEKEFDWNVIAGKMDRIFNFLMIN